jgi:beta-carotene hydroxylase
MAALVPEILVDRAWIGASRARGLGNPTAALLAGALVVLAGGTAAYLSGRLAWPVVVAINAIAIYVVFTPLHEAVHGVAHSSKRMNAALGRLAGWTLGVSFPYFRAVHLEHHSHTNDPARDPDLVVARRPRALVALWCMAIEASYRRHFFGRRLWRDRRDLVEALAFEAVMLGLLVASIVWGWWRPLVVCWLAPAFVALVSLAFLFDFLPHYPFDSRARYFDTRIYPGRTLNVLLLGQNHHLIHHLWTTIPWWRYQGVFRTIRDDLVARGARIGWRVRPLPAAVREQEAA